MKRLLEAINRGILRGLNEREIELLTDLDDENLEQLNSIQAKDVNNQYNVIIRQLQSAIFNGNITNQLKQLINDPVNFNKFKGVIEAYDKEHLKELIEIGQKLFGNDGNFNWINTSGIADMSRLFDSNIDFNGHIELWDTSNVENMHRMFWRAKSFNQNISKWNTSNVTDMSEMFSWAEKFNQPIDNWDVSNVIDMAAMFRGADKFNQPIGNWDVSKVTNMECMFNYAESFNQPIGDWNVSNVAVMYYMFGSAYKFNQSINNWVIKDNANTSSAFYNCPIKDEYKPKMLKN